MTDKQIIIDGCDVQNCVFFKYCDTDVEFSECLAHWHPNEDYSNVYYGECDAYPNCYYKQLKRAEQKLAKIKEIVKYYAEIKCEDCKYLSVHCVDCNEIIEKEVLQIIEGKENG